MKKFIFILIGILLMGGLLVISCGGGEETPPSSPPPEPAPKAKSELTLTIVYDNNEYDQRLETKWGFSCLIEGLEKTILFDTGGDGATLLSNMEKLKIDPAEIDAVVLSHQHGDHVGALMGLLEENSNVVVYLPQSFLEIRKDLWKSLGARVHEVSEAEELFAGVYTTGELSNGIGEQSLVIRTSKGLVVITGCAHPGVVHMVQTAKEILPEERVYLTMGGFHLMSGVSTDQIQSAIEGFRRLGVEKVAPCHCNGDETLRLFKNEYGEDYIDSGAGKIRTFP